MKFIKFKGHFDELEGAWAAAGFSLVLIVVGLPIWWWTTTVYRAGLPYSDIDSLSAFRPHHSLHLTVITDKSFSSHEDADNILKSKDQFVKFLVTIRSPDIHESRLLQSAASIEDLDENMNLNKIYFAGSLTVYIIPQNSSLSLSQHFFISRKRVIFMQENTNMNLLSEVINAMARDIVVELDFQEPVFSRKNKEPKFHVKRQVSSEPSYDIVLTLMLPQPHMLKGEWDVKKDVRDYLDPLVHQLEDVAELRIRSQTLYMTGMKINPRWSSKYKHYSLPEQQLPLTINDIEAKLGSFVSTRSSLHFIVYVPNELQAPLHIHTKDDVPLQSNSFLVPRWGSVMINNPPAKLLANKANQTLPLTFPIDSEWVMSTIIRQIHKLFPIPSLEERDDVKLISEENWNVLMDWQLDGLARTRVLSYLNNIRITLQSLCDLVGEISNMVVSDDVAGWVWAAVSDWRACIDASREGRLKEATEYCKDAFVYSDSAFFHPSMLALLYFPDNQKYAIYVPLFLPVCIPVVLSFRTILKLFRIKKTKSE